MTYAVRYLAGAYRAAGGNENRAVALYASGYYYQAKAQGFSPYAAEASSGFGVYRRVRSRWPRTSATPRRSIARGIIGITRCSAIFTSLRVRGEVEERSDEGEGASPRF